MRYAQTAALALIASSPILLTVTASSALAQEASDSPHGPWELNVFAGVMDDRPEFEPGPVSFDLEHEGIAGGRMGYHFDSRIFLETDILYAPLELGHRAEGRRERERLQALFFAASAGYNFEPFSRTDLFVVVGLGGVSWNADPDGEVDFTFNGGGGFRYLFSRRFALRSELRWHVVPAALAATRRAIVPGENSPSEVAWLPELSAGLSVFLGSPGGDGGSKEGR